MKNQGMFISLLLCFVVKLFNPFKVILLSKENEVYFACRFTSVWLVIDLSMLLFSDSVMKILKKIQISFSVGNFLSFEKLKINPCHSVHLRSFTIITLMLYPPHDATVHWLLFS